MNVTEKMHITIDLAKKALEQGEIPISAVIFHNDKIVSSSFASEKKDNRFLVHAEMKALEKADKMRFSVKERKEMQLFTSLEPCLMCLGAAMTFFMGEIYYSLEAPIDGAVDLIQNCWNKECKEIPSYEVPFISGGLLRSESQQLYRDYIAMHEPGPMYDFAKTLAELP